MKNDLIVPAARALIIALESRDTLLCDLCQLELVHTAECPVRVLQEALEGVQGPHEPCECGDYNQVHPFGKHPKCEYFEHHCEECHKRGMCTLETCPV